MVYKFFLDAFTTLVLLPANVIRFGITPDQNTALTNAKADFDSKFTLYVDPAKHSTPVVNDMNVSYLAAFKITEGVRKQIKGNTSVVLTGTERLTLGIPLPTPQRRHVEVPGISPEWFVFSKQSC